MNRHRQKMGFTLIEMLIAMAMVATIVSMVYGSYAATSRSLDRYDGLLKCSGRANLVLRLMARQIRGAYAPPADANAPGADTGSIPSGAQIHAGRSNNVQTETISPLFSGNALDLRGRILSFVTTAGLGAGLNAPRGLARIDYRYDRVTRSLAVSCRPYVDGPTGSAKTAQWRPLLNDVTTLDIEFHDGREWQREWSTKQNRLPRAVRVQLIARDEKDRPYHLGTTIPLLSQVDSAPSTSRTQKRKARR